MKTNEKFTKFSANDMYRMWRTVKEESGSHPLVRPYPGAETHLLSYWMNLMEDQLAEEIESRPTAWESFLKFLKRK
jgi:hypothetical protein